MSWPLILIVVVIFMRRKEKERMIHIYFSVEDVLAAHTRHKLLSSCPSYFLPPFSCQLKKLATYSYMDLLWESTVGRPKGYSIAWVFGLQCKQDELIRHIFERIKGLKNLTHGSIKKRCENLVCCHYQLISSKYSCYVYCLKCRVYGYWHIEWVDPCSYFANY